MAVSSSHILMEEDNSVTTSDICWKMVQKKRHWSSLAEKKKAEATMKV